MTEFVTLTVKDASPMRAYVSAPDGAGPFPGVIVFQEAFGVNSHIQDVTNRIAALGYVAIAPELFHRTAPAGFVGSYSDFQAIMPHFQGTNAQTMIDDAHAAYEWLTASPLVQHDKIGAIGFCMGGRAAYLANTAMPLAASVSFYGGGMHMEAERAAALHGPQLLFWGGKDTHIKPEHVQTVIEALNAADKDYINVVISYANHAFFCNDRPAYHPQAAKEAWGMTKEFLKNKLG